MKSGKAPGPDGFIILFYKKFSHKLYPILKDVFTEIIDYHQLCPELLPPTMSQAFIKVVYKKGKDPLKCDSYRPISLLSNDHKISAKILAVRLKGNLRLFPLIQGNKTSVVPCPHAYLI